MISITKKFILLSSLSILAAACASPFNSATHSQTIAEAHPISVDNQTVTLTIDTNPATDDISSVDHARLRAFADAYLTNGHGPVTVTAPSGTSNDIDGQEAASDIRKSLNEFGVPWSSIKGATYRTGAAPSDTQIIVSYTRYVATASECGNWPGTKFKDYRNLRHPNMGCATQNNIAALVADPHDLIAPSEAAARDSAYAVRGVEQYRDGNNPASEIDGAIDTAISSN